MSLNTVPWHSVVVEAPGGGWLAPGTPLLVDRSLELRVVLSCDSEPVLAVALIVPAPGIPREFAERVVAATRYSQLASVLAGGATSGSALGRTMAMRSMVMCDADAAVGGGVLDLGLVICGGEPGGGADSTARSAVVSNYVLTGGLGASLLLVALLWTRLRHCPVAETMRCLCLPSTLLPACCLVLPSTAASTTLLAARLPSSPCVGSDIVLVLCGTALVLAPTVALTTLWRTARGPLVCERVNLDRVDTSKLSGTLQAIFMRRWKWHAGPVERASSERAHATQDSDEWMRSAWVVLLEYRVVWYAALDSALLSVLAILAVAGGLDASNAALCRACTATLIVLMAAQVLVLAVVRPFTTLFSFVHALVCLVLTCLSVAAQLIFTQVSSTDTSGLWLTQVSAACDLAVVGVTAVRMLFDGREVAAAVCRRCRILRHGHTAVIEDHVMMLELMSVDGMNCSRSSADGLGHDVVLATDEPLVANGSMLLGTSNSVSLVEGTASVRSFSRRGDVEAVLHEVERRFWDASGAAIIRGDDATHLRTTLTLTSRRLDEIDEPTLKIL